MNFDRLNPLSNYLFPSSNNSNATSNTNTTKTKLKDNYNKQSELDSQLDSEISDWGIENPTQPNSKSNTSTNGLLLSPSVTSTSTSTTNIEDHYVPLHIMSFRTIYFCYHLHNHIFTSAKPH